MMRGNEKGAIKLSLLLVAADPVVANQYGKTSMKLGLLSRQLYRTTLAVRASKS